MFFFPEYIYINKRFDFSPIHSVKSGEKDNLSGSQGNEAEK